MQNSYAKGVPSVFDELPLAPPDPIFAAAERAGAAGSGGINATIGMIMEEDGTPSMLPCVRRAAREWAATAASGPFAYSSLLGVPAFRSAVTRLIFGNTPPPVASVAATGGTGAVLLNLKLLKLLGITEAILPVPSWPNHRRMLVSLGFAVREVPYLTDGLPSLRPVTDAVASSARPCAIVLQVCGHNPTGLDPFFGSARDKSEGEWKRFCTFLHGTENVVLLDMAYQGLAHGIEEDAFAPRLLAASAVPLLVAWSASKNHSAYGLRAGLACASCPDSSTAEKIESHYRILTREVHSTAATPGQQIVALVQEKHADDWRAELDRVRVTLRRKRAFLQSSLPAFSAALDGFGLYALLPLSPAQVDALARKNVFLTGDGRVNIAGIPEARLPEFCASIREVL